MTGPPFTSRGDLPAGIHDLTLQVVQARYALLGVHRQHLNSELIRFLKGLATLECVTEVYLDGSFITTKEHPADIDVCVIYVDSDDAAEADAHFAELQDYCLQFTLFEPRAIDVKFESSDADGRTLRLFQSIPVKDVYFDDTAETRKGVIRLIGWREAQHQ